MQNRNLDLNIYRLYLIKIAKWFMLVMPIVFLFYQENGLSQFDIFVLQGIYSLSIVILEIPSGYFADVLGRKNTIIAGSFLGVAGYIIYSFSNGFTGFLLAEIFLGTGQSLVSGADSAILYDTLKAKGEEHLYLKMEGRVISIGNFAEATAGVLGGFLATLSLRTPFYFQTAVAALAIPASLTLFEPFRETSLLKIKFMDILKISRYSLIENKYLRWNIFYSAIIGTATLSMAWFVQPYFKSIEMPISYYGILWTLLNLSVGITAIFAYRFEDMLGKKKTILFITIAITGGYLLIAFIGSGWGIPVIFFFYLARGIATPILKDYINKNTKSDIRATVLSIRNFVLRILFAIIGPFLGWTTDAISLYHAMTAAGLLFFVLSGGTLIMLLYKSDLNEHNQV